MRRLFHCVPKGLTVGLIVGLTLHLAACSTTLLDTKKIDYKSAARTTVPTLEIPPDLTAPSSDERYIVPDINPRDSATYSAYNKERAGQPGQEGDKSAQVSKETVLPQVDNARIERAGTQRWLVVSSSPDKLWPTVKSFWQDMGFNVNVDLPEAGIIETDWAENRAKLPQDMIRSALGNILGQVYSTSERDKFRMRLEPGATRGTTEVYISHRGMMEVYTNEGKDRTAWQPRPSDPELEAEMLRRLMVRLGTSEAHAKALVASSAVQQERAKLQGEKGEPGNLRVEESFDRAWRRVGLALDRIGFPVEDRDRSKGLYYIKYISPEMGGKNEEKVGFLDKLKFWRSSNEKTQVTNNQQFRIYISTESNGQSSKVQVLTREGGVDQSETARQILSLLLEQLK